MDAIFASGLNGEFGFEGRLPWDHIPEDMKFFKETTMGKVLVCGKNTYESLQVLPPLKGRTLELVSRRDDIFEGNTSDSLIIGGTSLLTVDNLKKCDTIYHTLVLGSFEADTFINEEVIEYLETLKDETIMVTDNIVISKYTRKVGT
jgi:dihydrofolate reductase